MTKAKPLPEIARCACGRAAKFILCGVWYRAGCKCGWYGPNRLTRRGAILAWNRVMTAYRAVKNLVGRVKSAYSHSE